MFASYLRVSSANCSVTLIRVTAVTFNLSNPHILCKNAGQDEEWLHDTDMLDTDNRQKELLRYQPPDESKLSALRETKIREKQLKKKLMKLFDYLFILLVLILVSYGNRDPQTFLMRNSMEQEFIHPLTVSYPQGLDDVSLTNFKDSFLVHLFSYQQWFAQNLVIVVFFMNEMRLISIAANYSIC